MEKDIRKIARLYDYKIAFSKDDDCYIASCTELGGMSAHGDTFENAYKEIILS